MRTVALLAAGALALAACSGKIEGPNRHVPPSGTTVSYDCDNGKVLRATFEGLTDVHIITEGKDVVLHSVMSERGAKYKQAADEFWMEGNAATFETVEGKTDCVIQP